MSQLSSPLVVAFVSGKGGVGKTSLAVNAAWICSRIARTVYVDLDFPNQGATGLFAPRHALGSANAFDAIIAGKLALGGPHEVARPGLSFLPAVSWQDGRSAMEIARATTEEGFAQRLAAFIDSLIDAHGFEIVILDCHGGVDGVSAAAFQCADHTLMVTEADSVTFAGTLELLAHYRASLPPEPDLAELRGGRRSLHPHIDFVVNRLPGKYSLPDLERVYEKQLQGRLRDSQWSSKVLAYIPSDELLAESFGDYPFHAPLAPRSMFTRKVCYIVWSLLGPDQTHVSGQFPPLALMAKARHRDKVRRALLSDAERNGRQIIQTFGWTSTVAVISLFMLIAGALIVGLIKGDGFDWGDFVASGPGKIGSMFLLLFLLLTLGFYSKTLFHLMFYYRDQHRFQRAFFRALATRQTLWQRLTMFKLLVLRVCTSAASVLLTLYCTAAAAGMIALAAETFAKAAVRR